MNKNNKLYYDLVVNKEEPNSFISVFNREWQLYLDEFEMKYSEGKQLHVGNRLRPLLCCWGYLHSNSLKELTSFEFIAKVATSVEAIHKASIIIDDVIDGDIRRRGIDSFHIEYSEQEATFFAVCLLSGAVRNLSEVIYQTNATKWILKESTRLICNTVLNMCTGALKEITTKDQWQLDIEHINEIINLETVSLLRNSFLIGCLVSGGYTKEVSSSFSAIGSKCGYIFQIMNDLEPFCNTEYIIEHKGNLNSDCFRSRKNIVITYLSSAASKNDKALIKDILSAENNYPELKALFEKYQIKKTVFNDIDKMKKATFTLISDLPKQSVDSSWLEVFPFFINKLFEYCESVLNDVPYKW